MSSSSSSRSGALTPSQVITLDPSALTSAEETAIFKALIDQHPWPLQLFEKGVAYPVRLNHGNEERRALIRLTHDLVRERNERKLLVVKPHVKDERDTLLMDAEIYVAPVLGWLDRRGDNVTLVPLFESVIIHGEVDVCNLSEVASQFIGNLLYAAYDQLEMKRFRKGLNCFTFTNGETGSACMVELNLSHALIYTRSKSKAFRKYSYAVLGEVLGEGGFGEVFEVIGVLKAELGKHQLRFEPKFRIAKRQEHGEDDASQEVYREHNLAIMTPHLRGKPPTFIQESSASTNQSVSYRIEERMPGEDLTTILERDLKFRELVGNVTMDLQNLEKEQIFYKGFLTTARIEELNRTTLSRPEADEAYRRALDSVRNKAPQVGVVHDINREVADPYYALLVILKREQATRLVKARKSLLSTTQRLRLSAALLHALERQMHERKIIHRDIKPDNIIIDIEHYRAFIVDIGLSKVEGTSHKDHHVVGTYSYMALEVLKKLPATHSSDIASMGYTLGVLWGHLPGDHSYVKSMRRATLDDRFSQLFQGMEDVTDDEREAINELLNTMTEPEAYNRCSLSHAMSVFEELLRERLESEVGEAMRADVRRAYRCAVKCRHDMAGRERRHDGELTREAVRDLCETILSNMDTRLPDHPTVVRVLTDRLYIHSIDGVATLPHLRREVAGIRDDFISRVDTLDELLRKMHAIEEAYEDTEEASEEDLQRDAASAICSLRRSRNRCADEHYRLEVNSIVKLNGKFAKDLSRIESECADIVRRHHECQMAKRELTPIYRPSTSVGLTFYSGSVSGTQSGTVSGLSEADLSAYALPDAVKK